MKKDRNAHFHVAARTMVHLGAELISSDEIALFELIKNCIDAKSGRINKKKRFRASFHVLVRIPHERWKQLDQEVRQLAEDKPNQPVTRDMREKVLKAIDSGAPDAAEFIKVIRDAGTWPALAEALLGANLLTIEDNGHGMDQDELMEGFLTIGYSSKINDPTKLGAKGIGRLSAMRLGRYLQVRTKRSGEPRWHVLEVNWSEFQRTDRIRLEEVPVSLYTGKQADDPDEEGTSLRIVGLSNAWSNAKVESLARDSFSRFSDPFTPPSKSTISLHYNGEKVPIAPFRKLLFGGAHGKFVAKLTFEQDPTTGDTQPELWTHFVYYGEGEDHIGDQVPLREQEERHSGEHLVSLTEVASDEALCSLGSIEVECYWYNRRVLRAIDGIGDRRAVQRLVQMWAGGLMIFRNGYRIGSYGTQDEDWLEIDKSALGSQGYKVSRAQLVGRLRISRAANPQLVDQANREVMRQTPERETLRVLLQHVIEQFRAFLFNLYKEERSKEPARLGEIANSITYEREQVETNLLAILRDYPEIKTHPRIKAIRVAAKNIDTQAGVISAAADAYEGGRQQLLHLAGIGLMVEIVAHELNRSTGYALRSLKDRRTADEVDDGEELDHVLDSIEVQFKTIQKRLRVLEPMATAGRQRKAKFDLVGRVRTTLQSHDSQFRRHGIQHELHIKPVGKRRLTVNAVEGMVVQVLENLLSNTVYWLKQRRKRKPKFAARIDITLDTAAQTLTVKDNGPGVDSRQAELVFEAFFTTKPAGQGKGMGLFISREIAQYHGGNLILDENSVNDDGRLDTFIFSLKGGAR